MPHPLDLRCALYDDELFGWVGNHGATTGGDMGPMAPQAKNLIILLKSVEIQRFLEIEI